MTLKCHSLAANQWLSGLPRASNILLPSAVEVRSSGEGRGLGLFAARDVPAFSQLLSDGPLILMKPGDDLPELYQQFKGLSQDDQKIYLSLTYHENPARNALLKDKLLQRGFGEEGLEEMAKVAGIMQTNAFNVDLQDGQGSCHRALFSNIARINHSCAPNSHVCFYPPSGQNAKGRMIIHTLKPLDRGQEVLISYFSILLPRSERQEKAKKWGFECNCVVCDENSNVHQQFERQRRDIRNFKFRQATAVSSATSSTKSINSLLEKGRSILVEAQDCPELFPAVPELYEGLASLQTKGLQGRKNELKRRALLDDLEASVIWEAKITGKDSPATQRRLRTLAESTGKRDAKNWPCFDFDESGSYVVLWPEV